MIIIVILLWIMDKARRIFLLMVRNLFTVECGMFMNLVSIKGIYVKFCWCEQVSYGGMVVCLFLVSFSFCLKASLPKPFILICSAYISMTLSYKELHNMELKQDVFSMVKLEYYLKFLIWLRELTFFLVLGSRFSVWNILHYVGFSEYDGKF